eukprot:TRINITY_DN2566_c0_g1_i1.p1 TRINITY_DN2566_c0_g1~~TRINITY_DN2566_c0_g1_i1.p1  ORF type:complete len:168 (-),score=19.82 TRINITY_DN2566_c0_g1_i1:31-534(-)
MIWQHERWKSENIRQERRMGGKADSGKKNQLIIRLLESDVEILEDASSILIPSSPPRNVVGINVMLESPQKGGEGIYHDSPELITDRAERNRRRRTMGSSPERIRDEIDGVDGMQLTPILKKSSRDFVVPNAPKRPRAKPRVLFNEVEGRTLAQREGGSCGGPRKGE